MHVKILAKQGLIGKLFKRILNNCVCNWADSYHVYNESQAGFRAKMGTTDNLFVLHGRIYHMINNCKQLCAFTRIHVDFSTAFD